MINCSPRHCPAGNAAKRTNMAGSRYMTQFSSNCANRTWVLSSGLSCTSGAPAVGRGAVPLLLLGRLQLLLHTGLPLLSRPWASVLSLGCRTCSCCLSWSSSAVPNLTAVEGSICAWLTARASRSNKVSALAPNSKLLSLACKSPATPCSKALHPCRSEVQPACC